MVQSCCLAMQLSLERFIKCYNTCEFFTLSLLKLNICSNMIIIIIILIKSNIFKQGTKYVVKTVDANIYI